MSGGPRIVIVDDNPDDRTLEARLLRKAIPDVEIREVANLAQWREAVDAGRFDLVVTDYHLAWSDGLSILAEAKARWPERPVVIATGTGTEEVAVEAMKSGAEDYVLKSRERIGRLASVVQGALQRASGRALDRAARQQLEAEIEERARVTASLARITALERPEATADLICAEIRATLGLGIVAVDWFAEDSTIVLAVASDGPAPVGVAESLPANRSRHLRDRAVQGPWIEEWTEDDLVDPYLQAWHGAGFVVGAFVPLVRHGEPVGLLVGASNGHWSIEEISRRLPELVEYGALAGALIEPAMVERSTAISQASAVRATIAAGAFSTVFQPIVGLASNVVGGYEALSRFADGVSPAVHFAKARAAGVAVELELATLAAAIRAATILPAGAFLSLNVSAELVLAAADLAPWLGSMARPIVLELTEHEAGIESGAILDRVAAIGRDVRLAVDDAGAGYAGLRRILELRPDFVKLDIELVRGIHRDPAREALIAGMVHFARETECSLIAEGVERDGERRVLRRLGVSFGQGYLLGRPAPAATWVGPAAATLKGSRRPT